ncbi:MAG: HEAT repeat domain-containing protein [Anaerolineales bacterium]
MLTFYCPNCWTELQENTRKCPHCGYEVDHFESSSYEDKLLAALNHPLPERRIMAAQILGNLGSQRALKEFKNIIQAETDYFFLRAVLIASAKISSPDRFQILQLATKHESKLVRDLAVELLNQLTSGQEHDQWDRHTG